jgi:hypothetical protein
MLALSSLRVSIVTAFAFLAAALPAQQPNLSVQEILTRVRANIDASIATLPDIFCDEHLRSAELHNGKIKRELILDSVLQATRQSSEFDEFKEDRTLRTVDGKPPVKGKVYKPPFTIVNGFGGVFKSYFFAEFEPCNMYNLLPDAGKNEKEVVLEVSRNDGHKEISPCSTMKATTKAKATFWLDAGSLQIRRFEVNSPHAGTLNGFEGSTDYAFVPLGPKSYLLPASVHAVATSLSGSEHYVYDSQYSNCHRFGSSVNILPGSPDAPN